MDKKQLMQYRALLKEQPDLEREISRLYRYLECKAAEGKIIGNEGMFIETETDKPGPATKSGTVVEIKRQIIIKMGCVINFMSKCAIELDRQVELLIS